MSHFIAPAGGPGVGLFIGDIATKMWVRGGNLTKGDVMVVDTTDTDAGTTVGTTLGQDAAINANVVVPITAQLNKGFFCVAMETALDDTQALFKFVGYVDALVTPATTVGDLLSAANGSRGLIAIAAASKGIAMAETTDAGTAILKRVWFNGITGWGGY